MSNRSSPDSRHDNQRDRRREDDGYGDPSNTVLIKSVPDHISEDDLFKWFEDDRVRIRDVRLIPRRGARGAAFAFIEFDSVQAAADWMNGQQGVMKISDEYSSGLAFSRRSHKPSDRDRDRHHYSHHSSHHSAAPADWTCPNKRCNFINFAKRRECMMCKEPRNRDSAGSWRTANSRGDDGSALVGLNPCNTVILRGLDALTNEQRILEALALITSLPPKNCYVMREFTTGRSLGYAFMEFDSALNGKKIKDHFTNNQALEIDGKLIAVDFARNTYSTILASIQAETVSQAQTAAYQYQPTEYELQAQAASASQRLSGINAPQHTQNNGTQNLPSGRHIAPDVSRYQWDASSGYYYDPATGLYYDANSQYYYDASNQSFLYWDVNAHSYLPAAPNQASAESKPKEEKEDKKKKAKNIAKEMEKWAKSQNKKSKSQPMPNSSLSSDNQSSVSSSRQATTADTAYDLLMGNKKFHPATSKDGSSTLPSVNSEPAAAMSTAGLVASYGADDSDDDDSMMNESNHIDRQKLTCNLCERKFNSTAVLEKHVKMSDLHKQNLMKLKEKIQNRLTNQYRDRAKERRLKDGLSSTNSTMIMNSQTV